MYDFEKNIVFYKWFYKKSHGGKDFLASLLSYDDKQFYKNTIKFNENILYENKFINLNKMFNKNDEKIFLFLNQWTKKTNYTNKFHENIIFKYNDDTPTIHFAINEILQEKTKFDIYKLKYIVPKIMKKISKILVNLKIYFYSLNYNQDLINYIQQFNIYEINDKEEKNEINLINNRIIKNIEVNNLNNDIYDKIEWIKKKNQILQYKIDNKIDRNKNEIYNEYLKLWHDIQIQIEKDYTNLYDSKLMNLYDWNQLFYKEKENSNELFKNDVIIYDINTNCKKFEENINFKYWKFENNKKIYIYGELEKLVNNYFFCNQYFIAWTFLHYIGTTLKWNINLSKIQVKQCIESFDEMIFPVFFIDLLTSNFKKYRDDFSKEEIDDKILIGIMKIFLEKNGEIKNNWYDLFLMYSQKYNNILIYDIFKRPYYANQIGYETFNNSTYITYIEFNIIYYWLLYKNKILHIYSFNKQDAFLWIKNKDIVLDYLFSSNPNKYIEAKYKLKEYTISFDEFNEFIFTEIYL